MYELTCAPAPTHLGRPNAGGSVGTHPPLGPTEGGSEIILNTVVALPYLKPAPVPTAPEPHSRGVFEKCKRRLLSFCAAGGL